MMERPLSWAYPAMEASSWLTPSVASMTSSAMSAPSRCLRAITTESFSAIRCVLPLRRMPAVSMKRKRRPLCSTISSTASRVVPGMGETMARSEDGQAVQQRGLAHVGMADDGDFHLVSVFGVGSRLLLCGSSVCFSDAQRLRLQMLAGSPQPHRADRRCRVRARRRWGTSSGRRGDGNR